jgi:hypothetical protein
MTIIEHEQRGEGDKFDGNRLASKQSDLFGFHVVADLVADAVSTRSNCSCLVVGLEGEWGSGKSTLLTMLVDALVSKGASVAAFAPWLVGSRDALLQQLFTVLEKAVADQDLADGDATTTTVNAAKSGLARFRSYSAAVSGLGRMAGLAGTVGLLPGGELVEKGLKAVADTMNDGVHKESLEDVKKRTSSALERLPRRIVVVIDDLDRLEPKEAVEVLRLVQAVADFPNVSYILSYDRRRLAHGIETVTGTGDGAAYLEKLMQVVVPLPQAQPVALVDMFTRRLKDLTGVEELDDRLVRILRRHIGPRISTPRGVVRVLDSLRLLWPSLKGKVDLADLVWLQLVRAKDERLYRWMESYAAEAARPADEETRAAARARFGASLKVLLPKTDPAALDWSEIQSFLPLIKTRSSGSPDDALFFPTDAKDVLVKLRDRRLGSVEHARLYFGLLPPDGISAQKEVEALIEASGDERAVAGRLLELAKHEPNGGPPLVELVLDLARTSLPQLRQVQLAGLAIGLLTTIDDVVRLAKVADRAIFRATLSELLDELYGLLGDTAWTAVLEAGLSGDSAIDFLTSEIPEAGATRPSWLITEVHADRAKSHLAAFYARTADETLVRFAQYGRTMSAWRISNPDARAAFLDRVLEDDTHFKQLVLGLFRRLVTDQQESMRELSRHFFVHELNDYWGAETVKGRLASLAGADPDESRAIDSTIALISEMTES